MPRKAKPKPKSTRWVLFLETRGQPDLPLAGAIFDTESEAKTYAAEMARSTDTDVRKFKPHRIELEACECGMTPEQCWKHCYAGHCSHNPRLGVTE